MANDKTRAKLDGANAACRLSSDAPPVLVAVLDATECSETNGQDEEEGPCGSDDETDWEESQCGSGDNKGSGGHYSGGSGCSSLGICVGRSGAYFGEDTIDERCLLGRQGGFNVLVRNGVLCGEIDLGDEEGLKRLPEAMLAAVLHK